MKASSILTIPASTSCAQSVIPTLYYAVSVDDEGHLSAPLFKNQEIDTARASITFDNLLSKTPLAGLMKKILRRLEQAYGRPVEVEFAWDDGNLYLLQCRALAASRLVEKVVVPKDIAPEKILFTCGSVLFSSVVRNIEYIVYIDPRAYAGLSTFDERLAVGRCVRRINRLLENKVYALFGPGRWGTNDVKMGVRVGYEDINRTRVLAEIATKEFGVRSGAVLRHPFFQRSCRSEHRPAGDFPGRPRNGVQGGVFPPVSGHPRIARPGASNGWNCAGDTRPFMRAGAISSRLSKR